MGRVRGGRGACFLGAAPLSEPRSTAPSTPCRTTSRPGFHDPLHRRGPFSINLAGREIDGIVDPGDYEKVRDEPMGRLGSFVDPKTGNKPMKAIHKGEGLFKGQFAERAPDILLVPAEGHSLAHAKSALEDADWVSGDHRLGGTIVAVGPGVKPFESQPTVRARADACGGAGRSHRRCSRRVGSCTRSWARTSTHRS